MDYPNLSMRHVRRNCLACCCDDRRAVIWCPCDGLHTTRCEFWPYRFGVQPATFQARWGDRLLTPETMPPATADQDDLPASIEAAALGEISVEGYCQPAVDRPKPAGLTPAEQARRAQAAETLRRARARKAEGVAIG